MRLRWKLSSSGGLALDKMRPWDVDSVTIIAVIGLRLTLRGPVPLATS
jgi:hypothetical protein